MRLYKNQYFPCEMSMPVDAPRELRDQTVLGMHKLPARTTVLPASQPGVYYRSKDMSDRIVSLNGDYRFALFSDAAPAGFESAAFDDGDWDLLDVPSMWQYRGYGEPTYPNVEYAFPFDPPNILRLNPVGCYRRSFTLTGRSARAILHFEGVDNAFYVYVNGEFAGFSKGSRNPAEFDVSALLREGENLLAVKVYTWSDASYLENQDMLLANGIFRDVYLILAPDCALWDYHLVSDTHSLSCKAELFEAKEAFCRFTLDGESVTVPFIGKTAEYTFTPDNPRLWTAETPNLYDLTIEVLADGKVTEVHAKRVGFRTVAVEGHSLLINGRPIYLKGINRHENNCDNGRTVTVEQTLADLALIKAHNINAIRCSHYPNLPAFYEYASELGLYVMDEADLESHGCSCTGDQGFLNKLDSWYDAFHDRVYRMAERDKNETCVVIWSVGNEIGSGQNADRCAQWLRARPDPKPVQLSGTSHGVQDFLVGGYFDLTQLDNFCRENAGENKPMFLIEYAHAMGNSPGNLMPLWDYIMAHKELSGGFVWEFRSHGKRRGEDMLYGGDFHDDNHWSNFTLDGYCTSDGTPKPTFDELTMVFAPVRFTYEDGVLTLRSTRDFTDTADLRTVLTLSCDGRTVSEEERAVVIPPRGQVSLPYAPDYDGIDCFLTVSMYDGERLTAQRQFALPATREKSPAPAADSSVRIEQDGFSLNVSGKGCALRFENGLPVYYEKNGRVLLNAPAEFVCCRAETDNDGITGLFPRWKESWETARLHRMKFYAKRMEVKGSRIRMEGILAAPPAYTGFQVEGEYTLFADGMLGIDLTVKPYGNMPKHTHWRGTVSSRLPRFGLRFRLDKGYSHARWFGRGPEQSYADAVSAAPVGLYQRDIDRLNFRYDVPQETGNREDVRFVQISDGTGSGSSALTVYGSDTFAFSLHPWRLEVLRAARHRSELHEDEYNYLYIDYRNRALGSMSCGPDPEPEFDFEPHDFRFVFALNGESLGGMPEHYGQVVGEKTVRLSGEYQRIPLEAERSVIECRE